LKIISFRAKSEQAEAPPTLEIAGRVLPVIVRRHPQAKGYKLRYDAVKVELRLTMPDRGRIRAALDWVGKQGDWVMTQMASSPDAVRLLRGATLPVEGMNREIVWDRSYPRTPKLEQGRVIVGGTEESVGARIIRWLKARALDTLRAETYDMADGAGLSIVSVSIGDPRGRWGSCSSSGAIRYSWRLILVPPDVRRATVAHEVAHRLHMDHSPAFHAAHADLLGEDPASAREWLRKHGAGLHRFTV
jgi:predicted metal-dependent hydrolase